VIMVAVRWYLRYALSYRDVEELLAERGITVDHVTIYRWVQRFTPLLIDAARPCRHLPGDRWFVDETYVKVAGRWVYLYRAIDQYGRVIDVLVSPKRDLAATRPFFSRTLEHGSVPTEVTTDRAPAYPRVTDELIPAAFRLEPPTRSLQTGVDIDRPYRLTAIFTEITHASDRGSTAENLVCFLPTHRPLSGSVGRAGGDAPGVVVED
jgi:transposase-like protein